MKIVGCGFQKTASSSLRNALRQLGYRTAGYSERLTEHWMAGRTWPIRLVAYRYDAMQDWPWALAYRELDRWFPGSLFILTVRDLDTWYPSLVRHVDSVTARNPSAMRRLHWAYGTDPRTDRDSAVARYSRHNDEARRHFSGSGRLLEFDAEAGDGWEELCGFLDKPIPGVPYPHVYKSA
jgi:hypothetical protein